MLYEYSQASVYNWETMEWSDVAPLNDRRGFHLCTSDGKGGKNNSFFVHESFYFF